MKKSHTPMTKPQREFLRIKLDEAVRRRKTDCCDYLTSKQLKQVTEALEIIQDWIEAKCNARNNFQEELNIYRDKAKEALLFGTKEEFDKHLDMIEGLPCPAIMVERVRRGKR